MPAEGFPVIFMERIAQEGQGYLSAGGICGILIRRHQLHSFKS